MTYPTAPVMPTVVLKVEVLAIVDGRANVRVTTVHGKKMEAWVGKGGTITYDLLDVPGDVVVDVSQANQELERIHKSWSISCGKI
jgi:hypothetical protein